MQILIALWPLIRPLIEFVQDPSKIKANPKGFTTYAVALILGAVGLWRPDLHLGDAEQYIYVIVWALVGLSGYLYARFSRVWLKKPAEESIKSPMSGAPVMAVTADSDLATVSTAIVPSKNQL